MKQNYRIGAYLEESKLKISIMKGYRNISNIEFLVYDLDLLLIQLQKLWEIYKTKFIVEISNVSIIRLFKQLNLVDLLYEEKPFDIKLFGISFNQSKKEIFEQLDKHHKYNETFIESIKLGIDYDNYFNYNKTLEEINNLEHEIKYLNNKLNLLKQTL